MALIELSNLIEGALGPLRKAGAPSGGTSEVQTLTLGGMPTGGTFKLAFGGGTTGNITWSATNGTLIANIQSALVALSGVGAGGVNVAAGSLTAGIGTVTLTFAGGLGRQPVSLVSVAANGLTGTSPTVAVGRTTAGVVPAPRAATGALVLDETAGKLYQNSGTVNAPTWGLVASQS